MRQASKQDKVNAFSALLSCCLHVVAIALLVVGYKGGVFGSEMTLAGKGSPVGSREGNVITMRLLHIPAEPVEAKTVSSPKVQLIAGGNGLLRASDPLENTNFNAIGADLQTAPLSQGSGYEKPVAPTSAEPRLGEIDAETERMADGGDPHGNAVLLSQIAKCLPSGIRPAFPLATLEIDLDNDGALSAPPRIRFANPLASRSEVLIADYIVQAALQCGPYTHAPVRGATVSLAVDFSKLGQNNGPPAVRPHSPILEARSR